MISSDVGNPVYLTDFIENDDLEGAREASRVVEPLDGLSPGSTQPDGYSGFFRVDGANDKNMFFWFFPATVN